MSHRKWSTAFRDPTDKEVESHAEWGGTYEALCAKLADIPKGAKLAIVGSTRLTGDNARNLIRQIIHATQPSLVISGGADGIDSLAVEVAKAYGIDWQEFKPDRKTWRSWGDQKGFEERNREIAYHCTALIRIAWVGSTTYGSGWTRDRARDQGKPTEEFWLKLDTKVDEP